MRKKAIEPTQAELIHWFNHYLAAGHGRGRLTSAATVYDGKVGYFRVHPLYVYGERQNECIVFACMPHDDILITVLPPQPKTWGMSLTEIRELHRKAIRDYPVIP